jgi:hypothetical protein
MPSEHRRRSGAGLEAPMVFVGYGLAVPEAHFDALAGMNLRGKIVNSTGPTQILPLAQSEIYCRNLLYEIY